VQNHQAGLTHEKDNARRQGDEALATVTTVTVERDDARRQRDKALADLTTILGRKRRFVSRLELSRED
jgi:hypothetical protein